MDAMPNPATELERALALLGSGGSSAPGEVIRLAYDQLQQLAQRLLKGFPGVRRWTQARMAEFLHVSVRTIGERRHAGLMTMHRLLAGQAGC